MSTTKHTPGPWSWTDEYQARDLSETWTLIGPDGYGILSCDGKANSPMEFHPSNARLITAAPELLEVLKTTLGNIKSLGPAGALDSVPMPYQVWTQVVADAIAKATGEQQC